MKVLGKYWKVLLALVLIAAAALIYVKGYQEEKIAYEAQSAQLKMYIKSLESAIQENMRYADVQDKLEDATNEVNASRLELYEHFPVELKEEDQIMYVLYLEKLFGTEIFFKFNTPQALTVMRDGASLMGLTLEVNYETTYQGFQDMVDYLATDSRITSVQYASIDYDAATDTATGTVTLLLYLMDSNLLEYLPPDVAEPETGKDGIFG